MIDVIAPGGVEGGAGKSEARLAPHTARGAAALALLLITAAAAGLMVRTRLDWGMGAYDWRALSRAGYDLWAVGLVLQGLVLPMALVALATRTAAFRRVALGRASPRDRWRLVAILIVVQLLTLHLSVVSENEFGVYVIVVLVGGLLGGWRVGLALGLAAFVMVNGYAVAEWRGEGPTSVPLRLTGPGSLRALIAEVRSVASPVEFTPFLWTGLAAGLGGDLLGTRRFEPPVAFVLGSATTLLATVLTAGYWDDPSYIFDELLVPLVVLSGLAVAALAYMVQGIWSADAGRRAEQAEGARVRAELKALRAQINPHFLFNSLNTIRYFIRKDPVAARRLLIDLSEVYQRALRAGDFVPLAEEISHVEAYLALEQARLGERLAVKWSTPPADELGVPVPTLILQPIVENAVIHGIGAKTAGGAVSVTIAKANGLVSFEVTDDGAGIDAERLATLLSGPEEPEGTEAVESIGLKNVDGRLRALYGEAFGLAIESTGGVGTTVRFRIPAGNARPRNTV